MGNSTATRATSRVRVPSTIPRRSVGVFNPDVSSTAPISFNSPTFITPLPSTTENIFDIPPITTTSPTFAFPVTSSVPTARVISPTTIIPTESPSTAISVELPTTAIPIEHLTTAVPGNSPTSEIPIASPPTVVTLNPPIPRVPVPSPVTIVPINSPIHAAPVTFFTSDLPISSPTGNINGFPVFSPDTSAVSPTLDLPTTPIASPPPTDVVIPVKSIISSNETYTTQDVSTSPMARVVSRTSRPAEVTRKRTISKNSISPSTLTATPVKHLTLSSADRYGIWSKFEREQQEKQKTIGLTFERTDSFRKTDVETPPVVPTIVAVPSFPLRSTAVYNPSHEQHMLTERTQSIHTDISIFKYYLTYNEAKHAIGDHTKATMFKMDTRLKRTPLPIPSLSLLTKNFSDGSHETDHISANTPSFGSLGLQHELGTGPVDQFSTEPRLHEKQQQRKHHQPSFFTNDAFDSTNSVQLVSSTVLSERDFSNIDQTLVQNNHQPLTSILKKPSSQFNLNPSTIQPNNKVFPESQKTDIENNPPTVRKKANQSITRSEKLIHRKKLTTYQN